MTRARTVSLVALLLAAPLALVGGASGATAPVGSAISGTTCHPFPATSWWHADIRGLPAHPYGPRWLSHMSTSVRLHPDFGPSYGDGPDYGIPVTVVSGTHPKVSVRFDYSSESDHVGYPFGSDTKIEGGRNSPGDKHAIVVDKSTCRLYETWNTRVGTGWRAGSGATWSLKSNALRPEGWTSADAAGLAILPGLLRYNEVANGYVDHAIRFTTNVTSSHHLWPARHDAGATSSVDYPPMGARFRLKASWDASGLGTQARVVVAAMKKFGLVLADNGSPWYFQGTQDSRWSEALISDLKKIPASAFVAVDTRSLVP